MKSKVTLSTLFMVVLLGHALAQDTTRYKLRLVAPVIEAPENFVLPHNYPSMDQALHYSLDFYELGYWGIDALGNKLFNDPTGHKLL